MIILEYFVALAYVLAMTVLYWLKYRDEDDNEDPFASMQPGKGTDAMTFQATCVCGQKFYLDRFADKGYVRWIISTTSLHYSKTGLEKFVEDNEKVFCGDIRQDLTDAMNCTFCDLSKMGKSNFSCQNHICDKLKAKLESSSRHIKWHDIEWQNVTSPESLLSYLYLPKANKGSYTGPESADISALLSLMDGCLCIGRELQDPTTIQHVRESRNEIIHSSDMTVTQQDLTRHISNFTNLLNSVPKKYDTCKEIKKITEIHTSEDKSDVLKTAETKALSDLHLANSTILETIRREIPSASGEQLKELKEQLKQHEIKEARLEVKLELYNVDTTELVKRKTEASELYNETERKLNEINEFTKLLEDTRVNETETLTLDCQLSKPNRKVQWMHNGKQIVTDGRIQIIADIHKHQLIIKDATPGDAGNYRCDCGNVSTDCTLVVNELEFTKDLQNDDKYEMSTVTLECRLSIPNKNVQWIKSGHPIVPNDRITVIADKYTHQLTIRDLKLEDAGTMRCECGNVNTQCTLKVKELALEFTKHLENQTRKETKTLSLKCQLSKPNQNVRWIKSGHPIVPNDRITIIADKFTHQLTIRDLKLEDAGTVRCECGNVNTQCTLKVKELAPEFTKLLENQTGEETGKVTLKCQLSKPNKKVQWMKDDQLVIPDDRIIIIADKYTHAFTITELEMKDGGNFRCKCENVSTECILKVNEIATVFTIKLEDIAEKKAETITMECRLSKPNKIVEWTKDGQQVILGDRMTVTADKYMHRLTITDLRLEDCGNYRCGCDTVNTDCTLTVEDFHEHGERELKVDGGKNWYGRRAVDVRKKVLENKASLQQLTLYNFDLSSLGDKLIDVINL